MSLLMTRVAIGSCLKTESQRIACKYDCTVLIWIVSAARAVTG
jgi:hypothetical protein